MFSSVRRIRNTLGSVTGSEESGFTIVEMLITSILMAIFLAGVVVILTQGFTFFGKNQASATLNQEGNKALDRIETLIGGCQHFQSHALDLNGDRRPLHR